MMFKGRHFDRSVILLCVRWYLAYGLSLRNLEEMMAEGGISVDHATVHAGSSGTHPNCWSATTHASEPSLANGIWTRHISGSEASGGISTVVAVLVRLSDENEVAPGQWYLEAGFGRLKDGDQENQTISRREIVIKKPGACPIVSA
jgi:hypothetical protein